MFDADREKPIEPEREGIPDSDLNSLAQSDSLRLYLREISRIPLLSANRESYLAERAEQGDKDARNHLACKDCRPLRATVVHIRKPHVIQPEHMEDSRVNVVNVDGLLRGSHADLVSGPVILSRFGATAGHPHREAPRIVIAPVACFVEGRASKLTAPNHQGVLQHAASLQVSQ